MPHNENNSSVNSDGGHQLEPDALQLRPRKTLRSTDPLVHHGRHFGRIIHAFCNLHTLIKNEIIWMGEHSKDPKEDSTLQEQKEHKLFLALLKSVPGLEEKLMNASSEEEVQNIAEMLQKGASGARSDDTKSLKSAIIDWITPLDEPLMPPILQNSKRGRGYHHETTGALLCPAGCNWKDPKIKDKLRSGQFSILGCQWPIFLYSSYTYDENNPSKGFLKSSILVKTFKHIFTLPSFVERKEKATKLGVAYTHGMTSITRASIAYAATQARFALSSTTDFNRNDSVSDSEHFYNSLLEHLDKSNEANNVNQLIIWWNRQVFPNYVSNSRPFAKNSALARIKAKRAAAKEAALCDTITNTTISENL